MTAAFERFIAAARLRPAIWRLLLGIVLIVLVYVAWLAAMAGVMALLGGREGLGRGMVAMGQGRSAGSMLLLLLSFGGLALGSVVAARVMHRRGPGSLIGPARQAGRDFLVAVAVVAVVYALVLLPWAWRFDAVPNLPLSRWAMLLPLALAGVALQTLAEEITFRGYLMQQLAARFRSPLVWMLLPALAFGALHWNPAETGGNTAIVIGAIGLFALAAADLTRRSGSLGAAWGMHFANNCIALLILATGDTLPGLALWRTPYAATDPVMAWAVAGDFVSIALTWAVLARWLARRDRILSRP
ncbi:CPBP family intramembrane glutamic endopeptidase [Frigidibacter sp. ROC022]|uniref:CPBP family intramembrane glutamic endopeptidase n=1 Tax=Frigidibacter sp. ROC022 TaxID=2971796 RepID=UPI00215B33FF|nr:CPBP family intramembrane glutamic endopeptidase [Frigidibacter sp. ROC022]MCR8726499.1 CPBP family intramembrane metalloprotease [Frigidibacter sp. ROC022]